MKPEAKSDDFVVKVLSVSNRNCMAVQAFKLILLLSQPKWKITCGLNSRE
jgi:hypothetical protein